MWRATCSCMYEYSLVFLRCFDVRTARICSCMHKIIDVSSKFDFGRCSRVYMKQRRSAFYHALCAFLYFWWYYFWILFVAVIGINLSLPGLCRSRGWNHFRAWNMNISTIPGTRYAVLLQGFVLVQQYLSLGGYTQGTILSLQNWVSILGIRLLSVCRSVRIPYIWELILVCSDDRYNRSLQMIFIRRNRPCILTHTISPGNIYRTNVPYHIPCHIIFTPHRAIIPYHGHKIYRTNVPHHIPCHILFPPHRAIIPCHRHTILHTVPHHTQYHTVPYHIPYQTISYYPCHM